MSYSTNAILRDLNGDPIPQIWDEDADAFVPANMMEYYGDDAGKTAITGAVKGAAYVAIDTKKIYLWDGTAWVEFIDLS